MQKGVTIFYYKIQVINVTTNSLAYDESLLEITNNRLI